MKQVKTPKTDDEVKAANHARNLRRNGRKQIANLKPRRSRAERRRTVDKARKSVSDPSLEFSPEAKKVFEKWADDLVESGQDIVYPNGQPSVDSTEGNTGSLLLKKPNRKPTRVLKNDLNYFSVDRQR